MAEIRNRDELEAIFGGWPSFHDAEVLAIRLERGDDIGSPQVGRKPHLELDVHAFEMTSEVTDQGHYALRNHTLVTFRFDGIDNLKLDGFNQQNVLWDLSLKDITDRGLDVLRWEVTLPSSLGVEGSFLCEDIQIIRAVPYEPPSERIPEQGGR